MAKPDSILISSRMKDIPEYLIWKRMRQRCGNPRCDAYHLYGARGIKVCSRWQAFKAFWDDMGPRPSRQHSIDRIDNDGDYAPGNCRWATSKQQCRNTRHNRILTHDGKSMCLADWCARTGLLSRTLRHRLDRGWSTDRALTTPARHRSKSPKNTSKVS